MTDRRPVEVSPTLKTAVSQEVVHQVHQAVPTHAPVVTCPRGGVGRKADAANAYPACHPIFGAS